MKIKKFNESSENPLTDYATLSIDRVKHLKKRDIDRIHQSGRKIYIVTPDFVLTELKDVSKVRIDHRLVSGHFPYLLFVT